ncbi:MULTISPECIES: hypothetical protein [Methylobacterium]|uniref:Rieske domain-containing protein n=2 Tax=Pseudomonadota TaxID=1224 RepID=A0ABQ4SV57_9HYPH|nr:MULTISPECIES: hypothetical protein [Methylobacterium]PIU06134.1 MAG: hypothetical protein COT56_11320 [Methylobacterium sp. CG09_land_8_20_14_0_10_71_15]PIU11746.1 MAG: hypothetical protein COT28_18430 [Methylobacterium sp. CG08_land_8_20_14_0_20_71_15]GBU18801.1 hypothetical protein AwMethylo_30160 [Methylobacterium sp.]GJE07076.1 hypothetical protein AOPFMNJM_2400 [Methylobacterium jeotgali]
MSVRSLTAARPTLPAAGFLTDRPDLGHAAEGWDLADPAFFAEALDPVEPRHLPPTAYRSLAFANLEDDAVWTRNWVCIGTQQEIPKTSDLLPFTVGHHGVHVQRRADGGLVGRFNKAQHGGCRAVPLQCQTGTKTRCSFTACGYSRDGLPLSAAPDGGPTPAMHQYLGLRPERLLPIAVRTSGSMIFVHLDAGTMSEPLENLAFEDETSGPVGTAQTFRREYPVNWKLLLGALAAGEVALPTSDSIWLTTTLKDGSAAEVRMLFPNLILFSARGETCGVIVQPTALGETLCRIALFGNRARSAGDWLAEFDARARYATELQRDLDIRETRPAARPPLPNAAERWLHRRLAAAVKARPRHDTTEPLYATALGRRR